MHHGIARPFSKGNHSAHDQLDMLCCANACRASIDDEAPVPLCANHLRLAFAHVLMGAERMSAGVADPSTCEEKPTQAHRGAALTTVGFVYFVRFSDRIKIGWSGNPTARLKNIPHDEVLAIVPGTMEDERKLHAAFARLRVTGEWFQAKRDLLDFIKGLKPAA